MDSDPEPVADMIKDAFWSMRIPMVVSFEHLSAEEFEEFCYDLLGKLGFKNREWRKGANHGVTAADKGRDIEAELEKDDVGTIFSERWFVECKRLKSTASVDVFDNLFRWAQAERPAVVLLMISGFLSLPTKEHLHRYEEANRPAFRIRVWDAKEIEDKLVRHPDLARKYRLKLTAKDTMTQAEKRIRNLGGKERWYEYLDDLGKSMKIPVIDYLGMAAGLTLNDQLPRQPIRFRPRFYRLKAIAPESDGSFVQFKMPYSPVEKGFELGDRLEVAGIMVEVIGYNGESEEYGMNV